jgi:hypothetical protein
MCAPVIGTDTYKQSLFHSDTFRGSSQAWGEEAGAAVAGLVVLGACLAGSAVVVTLWAVVDVAVTPWFTLHVEGWNKGVWLLIACVPVVGAAYWIHLARPRPGIERIVPTGWMSDSDERTA